MGWRNRHPAFIFNIRTNSNGRQTKRTCMRCPVLLFSFPMILQGQCALITGSGRGIGRAIASLFAKEGASVFLCARSQDQLASTAEEISHRGGQVAFATANVAIEDDCRRIVDAAREKFGPVTIL